VADVYHTSLLQEALQGHGRMSRSIIVQKIVPHLKMSASLSKSISITFQKLVRRVCLLFSPIHEFFCGIHVFLIKKVKI
jgi:hypothetical protein